MKYRKELKIGIFVTAVLVATFFIINYLRGKDVFNREMELRGRFENVAGLVPSAVVQFRGCNAGQVSSVEYRQDSDDFEVVCSIDRKFRIPEDSRMTIFSTSIMGGKGIVIEPGTSGTAAVDGDELQSSVLPDLVETIASGIGPLMESLSGTLAKLDEAVAHVNGLLGEENRAEFNRALADLRRTLSSVASITGGLEGETGEIREFIGELGNISARLSSVAEKADVTMDSVENFASSLEKSDIEGLVESVTRLSESIQNPDGSMGRFLKDGNIYNSADSLITELNDLIRKMKENPRKYMKISVF